MRMLEHISTPLAAKRIGDTPFIRDCSNLTSVMLANEIEELVTRGLMHNDWWDQGIIPRGCLEEPTLRSAPKLS